MVTLNRLQTLADRSYPKLKCGFRSECSTINAIFSICQLQEKCKAQRSNHSIQTWTGLPSLSSGVKQGYRLAPTLIDIFFAVMLKHVFGPSTEGVSVHLFEEVECDVPGHLTTTINKGLHCTCSLTNKKSNFHQYLCNYGDFAWVNYLSSTFSDDLSVERRKSTKGSAMQPQPLPN